MWKSGHVFSIIHWKGSFLLCLTFHSHYILWGKECVIIWHVRQYRTYSLGGTNSMNNGQRHLGLNYIFILRASVGSSHKSRHRKTKQSIHTKERYVWRFRLAYKRSTSRWNQINKSYSRTKLTKSSKDLKLKIANPSIISSSCEWDRFLRRRGGLALGLSPSDREGELSISSLPPSGSNLLCTLSRRFV